MPEQAKKMQGFPDKFDFPVPYTHAMKQLGNSVAIDAIKECGNSLIKYMNTLKKQSDSSKLTKNKGKWTELYSFIKLINDKKLFMSDKFLNPLSDYLKVTKVSTLNIEESCYLFDDGKIIVKN